MKHLLSEFYHENGKASQYKVRIGYTIASALSGFIAGAFAAAFYFYFVFNKLLPLYCSAR